VLTSEIVVYIMIAEVNNYTEAIIIHKFFDILARIKDIRKGIGRFSQTRNPEADGPELREQFWTISRQLTG